MQMHIGIHMFKEDIHALHNGGGFDKLASGGVCCTLADNVNLFVPDEHRVLMARALMFLASDLMDMQAQDDIDKEAKDA